MNTRKRLTFTLIFIATCSLFCAVVITSIVGYLHAKTSLQNAISSKLIAIRDINHFNIIRYFDVIRNQIASFSNNWSIVTAMNKFNIASQNYLQEINLAGKLQFNQEDLNNYLVNFNKQYMAKNGGYGVNVKPIIDLFSPNNFALQYYYGIGAFKRESMPPELKTIIPESWHATTYYSKVHAEYHQHMLAYKQRFKMKDILLIEANTGQVVYSVMKNLDFMNSMKQGYFFNHAINKVFLQAATANDSELVVISDFISYLPFFDDLAAFIASPIFLNNNIIGVMVAILPIDILNDMLTYHNRWSETGLGQTGESYLISQNGTLRSESRAFIEHKDKLLSYLSVSSSNHDVIKRILAKQSGIGIQEINTKAKNEIFADNIGVKEYKNCLNKDVIGAYRPLDIFGLTWGIICEMNTNEAFSPVYSMLQSNLIHAGVILSVMLCIAWIASYRISMQLSSPIEKINKVMQEVAVNKDLTVKADPCDIQEINNMANNLNKLLESFEEILATTSANNANFSKRYYDNTRSSSNPLQSTSSASNSLQSTSSASKYASNSEKNIKSADDDLEALSNKLERLVKQYKYLQPNTDKNN